MSLLDQVHTPADLRRLKVGQLPELADDLRDEIVRCVSQTGGHFSSNLGSVELTIALHYAFETPRDLLVWDVGHQTYPHKILTGRRDRMQSLRQYGGLSGFCLRAESEYDVIAAGHASTSISAALGLAVARDQRQEKHHVVAIIGDGSMTAGMAFEAMNQAGHLGTPLIVVLNDNSMSISPSVGALTHYLQELMAGRHYSRLKDEVKKLLHRVPAVGEQMIEFAKGVEEGVRQIFTPGSLFEELGFRYVGPVNGHSVPALIEALEQAKKIDAPVLVHAITQKGKGYKYAEDEPVEYHGPSPFDPEVGIQKGKPSAAPAYTSVFGKAIVKLAERDPRIVAITASMPDGTGLVPFSERFPDRFFNTGIAEQHSVTLAAGLALGGLKPVVAIYSTFLQRGFDQIFHDVCLMDAPVVFALDRGGIAGNDGWTHHGLFDYAYFRIFPNAVVMAPKDENELRHMLATALSLDHPAAVRYPRGNGIGVPLDEDFRLLPVGKAEVLRRGKDGFVWAVGSTVYPTLEAAERLAREGIDLTVVNARFVKPLDRELLGSQLANGGKLATVEEHAIAGGFGSAVLETIAELELAAVSPLLLGVPDRFVTHGSQEVLRKSLGLDSEGIYFRLRRFFAAGGARAVVASAADDGAAPTAAAEGRPVRLDQLLVERGLFTSRERARRAVMAGTVEVDGRRLDKPGTAVAGDARLALRATAEPFVSRAGRKLAAALDHFAVEPRDRVCLDVGASTGGFTDCLLSRGAARVYAIDVGYGLIDQGLRNDPRVVVLERINARYLPADALPERVSLATIDVSFISVVKVVPALLPHLDPGALLLPLIKPQFEVGRGGVGRGGIVRDEELRSRVVGERAAELAALGLTLVGLFDSPVAGAEGNRESFALLRRPD